jgi:twitching motility protein PilT
MTLKDLFSYAKEKKASDIHLVENRAPIVRIDGKLYKAQKEPLKTTKEQILSLLSKRQKEHFLKEKELDFAYSSNETRFRINIYKERGHLALSARLINSTISSMQDLGMPEVVTEFINKNRGLILVTGPTGCGKSTSLSAMAETINQNQSLHISTIEDPIEFLFEDKKSFFTQRQVDRDTKSFANALKYVMRQDPNVIMVGEMRDLETIAAALTLAETGHLVISTLHTQTSAQTVERIIDVFPPHQQEQVKMQLSLSLVGVVSQRLLPKVNGGRIANFEVLVNNIAVANSIRENKIAQIQNIIQTSAGDGMITADNHLKQLLDSKLITKETFDSHKTIQKKQS